MMVRFEKWEGLGNDFVLLRDPGIALDDATVRRLCDRRFGVGADGVLLVELGEGLPRMIVRNADGSRPEMCGNGLRCVAGHLADRAVDGVLRIATDAGERACALGPPHPLGGDDRFDVTVDMGPARRSADLSATLDGREHRFLAFDLGNPHAVTFETYDDAAVDTLGPAVAALPRGGTNVEFCRVLGGRIAVTVWERGVGRTLACGTGACAVAAAACDTGRARFGEPIMVALPGGELEITIAAGNDGGLTPGTPGSTPTPGIYLTRMRGPARRVFAGEVTLA
jgi:diaminopimelate epimerase